MQSRIKWKKYLDNIIYLYSWSRRTL